MIDLVALVPCQPYEAALTGLLSRPAALGIRPIESEIVVNVERDPGCRTKSVSVLRSYISRAEHALVLFDLEGSGAGTETRDQTEARVEGDLAQNGWADRSAVVVVDPEIEAWVWSESPEVDAVLAWQGRRPPLRSWLKSETEFWSAEALKPERPKEAMRRALREVRKAVSSSVFRDLAERVSVNRCTDPAFTKLKAALMTWFGGGENT